MLEFLTAPLDLTGHSTRDAGHKISFHPSDIVAVAEFPHPSYPNWSVIYTRGREFTIVEAYSQVVKKVGQAKTPSESRPNECTSVCMGNRCALPTGHEGPHRLGDHQWSTQIE